ncbi:MFS transporter [Streptomyces sp. ET3-23]|uniref:MFS transporter n=1 Tax=Streptomyces sp. ET3-23 TaxID=2885643 RepID=UPI001D1173D6|nr:MFS transporter [Streptomyces sp. ET3-23]MCC2280654.1 MFS transporter [Streptomyces sp. ET3-23]
MAAAAAWFDFFLFAIASVLVFPHLFFPVHDSWGVAASLVVAVAARPLGGVLFGHLGDRYGRRASLVGSLLVTGGASGMVAVLPTYLQAGAVSPLLLVVVRVVQGVGIGGVWSGAVVTVAEHARPSGRGLVASWSQTGMAAGGALAFGLMGGLFLVLPAVAFYSWGWRVPYVLSLVVAAYGWWMRSWLAPSTPAVGPPGHAEAPACWPVRELLARHGARLTVGVGIAFGVESAFAVFSFGYIAAHLVGLGFALRQSLVLVGCGAVLLTVAIPLAGAASDRYGRRRVYLAGALVVAGGSAAFSLLEAANWRWPAAGACVMAMPGFAAMYGTLPALLAELFPPRVRVTGAGLSYQLAGIVTGPVAAYLVVALPSRLGTPHALAAYTAAALAVASLALAFARTADHTKGMKSRPRCPAPNPSARRTAAP